jgi:hypothetical protein
MKKPNLVIINNFKEPIKRSIKHKPKEEFWKKFDNLINFILY